MSSIDLGPIRRAADKAKVEYDTAEQQYRQEKRALRQTDEVVAQYQEALAIVQAVVQEIQNRVHRQIAGVVSQALEAVFDQPYDFNIRFEQKRGKTDAVLVFVRDGMEVDPMSASGGGVVDVAAFALRLACLLLHRPALRRLIVLDEPFKFVSAEYRQRLRLLLERLAQEMEVQILMVTHIPELTTGNVIHIG